MLFQCWPTVFDAGPTLKQHWVNAPCLPGNNSDLIGYQSGLRTIIVVFGGVTVEGLHSQNACVTRAFFFVRYVTRFKRVILKHTERDTGQSVATIIVVFGGVRVNAARTERRNDDSCVWWGEG